VDTLIEATASTTNTHVDPFANTAFNTTIDKLRSIQNITAGVMLPSTAVIMPNLGPLKAVFKNVNATMQGFLNPSTR